MKSRGRKDTHKYQRVPNREDIPPSQSSYWVTIWRGINLVMVVFFLLAAYVNLNDPDPYIWVPVYCMPAFLSIGIIISPQITENAVWRVVCVLHLAVCIVATVYLLAVLIELLANDIKNPLILEEGRELGGLIIIVLWLATCRFTSFGSLSGGAGCSKALLLLTGAIGCLPLLVWAMCFVEELSHMGHCTDMFPGMLGGAASSV